jgi:hypothetical protein
MCIKSESGGLGAWYVCHKMYQTIKIVTSVSWRVMYSVSVSVKDQVQTVCFCYIVFTLTTIRLENSFVLQFTHLELTTVLDRT